MVRSPKAEVAGIMAALGTMAIGLSTVAAAAEPGQPANGLKFSIAADKLEAKPGNEVKITLTFENVSAEKFRIAQYGGIRWELAAPDGESLQPGQCLGADMAPPGLNSFPELNARGTLSAPGQTIGGNPPSLYLPINFMSYCVYLLKPGAYNITAVYSNDMDKYWPGKAPNERQPVPGKVWKGEVRSNTLEIKFTGNFKAPPQMNNKPMWPPSGITPPQLMNKPVRPPLGIPPPQKGMTGDRAPAPASTGRGN